MDSDRGFEGVAATGRAVRFRNWWGLATYGFGGLTLFWGSIFTVSGVLAVVGTGPESGSIPLAGAFASALAAGIGVILLVAAVPLLLIGILSLLSARGARRGSRRWWLVGMTLYASGGLLALVSQELVGTGLFAGLLALGLGGRTALS